MDCLFCKIAEGRIPAKVVYEDDRVVAFEDIDPQAPVHTLVIPRKHIATTLEVGDGDKELVGHLMAVANRLAREKGIAESGFRLVLNTNADGGQAVYHLHLHLLGGRRMAWPPG
ncbi:MAG: histidine triad nucleotide-binding protein [Nitrospirota bacterium]|jgi:histidine triad (HIT) family protein